MSVQLLEPAADALGPLLTRVVFLGGATVALWLSDPGARRPRVTFDVDVVAEVTTLLAYSEFQADLRSRGFREDIDSGVICRWRHDERGILLDAVPLEHRLAGFSGRWLADAVAEPAAVTLPSGASVRTVQPSWLLTTKLEAFADRGNSDCLQSRDFEDIVTLVDGREELAAEVQLLPVDARRYVAAELRRVLDLASFVYGVEGALPDGGRERADAVTIPRLEAIAASA